ncbi:uncharacterized protein LOC141673307 [Apium graveolens]|uniref:uncharacterized protein LOC141673307 n=1 Tax=Apium graveolens TaxID=4045 RepID=UPI003D799AD7
MKESDQLDDFYIKLNGLMSNIRSIREEIKESYIVKKLLRAMPTRFLQITSTIEQFGDLDKITVKEAMGSLKVHDERIKGKGESNDNKLHLTEEEWRKRESNESKLLLKREEWQNRSNKTNDGQPSFMRNRDKCRVKCFNCSLYGHFASECRKLKLNKEYSQESNLARIEDDELALLLAILEGKDSNTLLLNESDVRPCLALSNEEKPPDSNLWYLDNGASNHMTG